MFTVDRYGLPVAPDARAVSEVVGSLFACYPHKARLAGAHEYDGVLPGAGPDPTALVSLGVQLGTVVSDDPEQQADLSAAARLVEAERFRAEELRTVHTDPLGPLAETDVEVYRDLPAERRNEALAAHLRALPGYLDSTAEQLDDKLPAGLRLRAAELARGSATYFEGELRSAPGAEAAARALRRYAGTVSAAKPIAALLGPERLAGLLLAQEGIETPVEELLAEARDEVDRLAGELDRKSRALGGTVVELLSAQALRGPVLDTTEAMVRRLRDFWLDADLVTVDPTALPEIRRMRQLDGTAAVEIVISGPLEEVRRPHVLYVPDPDLTSGGSNARVWRQYLNEPMLEVIAVHETFAGHYLHARTSESSPSIVRTCFRTSGFTEGWAHYAEELAVEHGLADGRPLVELAQLRAALVSASRLLIFLSVHLRRWKFQDAAEHLVRVCGWAPQEATREALTIPTDLDSAMYCLGKLVIRGWRAGAGGELKTFHDRVLRAGFAPLATVGEYWSARPAEVTTGVAK
ncbi:DUF885 family protein [Streptomyces sp. NPDC059761]|uniref:DUF885 family protein n=1 Tax=Streptomyces sp. NPDC059761 TaxID=3346937 RepID=UPI00366362A8